MQTTWPIQAKANEWPDGVRSLMAEVSLVIPLSSPEYTLPFYKSVMNKAATKAITRLR